MNPAFSKAVTLVKSSGFQMGTEWEAAHQIAQDHEGERLFDSLHALLHRIEGDSFNASYWDRQAGTDFGGSGFDAELAALVEMAANQ